METCKIVADNSSLQSTLDEIMSLVKSSNVILEDFNRYRNYFGDTKIFSPKFEIVYKTNEIVVVINPSDSLCEILAALRINKSI